MNVLQPGVAQDSNSVGLTRSINRTRISVVVPTYRRESVLLNTIRYLLALEPGPDEILIVDQTEMHSPEIIESLSELNTLNRIRWVRLRAPSITVAMNEGLKKATANVVLFLDDDIIPSQNLIRAHAVAHENGAKIVAGQVLQPGEEPEPELEHVNRFQFRSSTPRLIGEFMGGNFSINRQFALKLGGFDENFVHVAYRFEAEFAARAIATGEKILFEPGASIRHLKASSGGTRSYGHHLTTIKPSHSVGEYYYLLKGTGVRHRLQKIINRPFRAIRTTHHLTRPWWIPVTLTAESLGFAWALGLALRGPRLIKQ